MGKGIKMVKCDMPHGTFCYLSDIEEYINKANDKNYFFMVKKDNDIIY
ncbi:hypothetical protein [Clostridium chauvoei]|nr:hypothetical protein [Clostridium chauvoei]MBX7410240.1 hypothetical protein [Clostridium chauvoei]